MSRLLKIGIGVLLLLAAAVVLADARSKKSGPDAEITGVVRQPGADTGLPARLVVPEIVDFSPRRLVTGDLKPEQFAPLAFPIPGTLLRIEAKRGDRVKIGQVLAVLDSAGARASAAQAAAGLSAAEAQARMAEDALARLGPIREQQGISDAQLVQVQAQRDLAAAQVLAAKAQRDQADVHLRNHALRAPFDGVITRVPDGIGIAVNPGVPLVVLEATQTLVLETSVTIEDAVGLKAGASAVVTSSATGVKTSDAKVRTVLSSADPASHRVPVLITVPNADQKFVAHSMARAEIAAGENVKALRLPAGALVQRDGGYSIWTAGDSESRARLQRVRLLAQESDFAVVEPVGEALPNGTRVVDLPPVDLAEGTRLTAVVMR